MEVISCSSSQCAEQVETRSGIVMDELLLGCDVEDATNSELLVNAEKHGTNLVMDMEETELLGNNGEGESSSEPKWLQQDEPMALWVKWRGKWQAGIRCARADWPLKTLRGKPTHDRKKYFVIFFPHTKNYSWADMQLVRSIDEFPDPIAYKSHKIGLKMVKDLTSARRYVMRKLTVGMLNIVDQFHSEVVVEAAKDIIIWKEFAMEASRSTCYQDLGKMLVKLQSMILQHYMDPIWLENSFPSWVQKCNDAVNAESIELLNEELDSSIRWNEVKSITDTQMQLMVFSEWKTWKHDITKWFSISRRSVEEIAQQNSKSVFHSDVQASHKRPKLEVRRAETTNASQIESDASPPPQVLAAIDSEFFSCRDNSSTPKVVKDEDAVMLTPENGLDLWDGIVVEAGGSQLVKTKDANELSPPQVGNINESDVKKPFGSGNKSQQCIAFIEAKGRQCVRWANEGDVYCCVHLASRFTTKSTKNEGSPAAETPMCGGVTVLGTNCKHRSLPGMFFCKKHRPQTDMEMTPVKSSSNLVKRKVAEIMSTLEASQRQDLVPFGGIEGSVTNGTTSFTEMLKHCSKDDNLCVGSCSEISYVPCHEFSTKHTLYCEKHLPNWLKRARNGKSRIISKEVFVDLLRSCSSREEKLPLHQACDVFYKLFKSLLSLRNPVPMDIQLQWAISEASRDADARVGDFLMKLVSHEKERLSRIWGFSTGADEESESLSESPNRLLAITNGSDDKGEENKWSFGGFACAICLDSFVNRKVLETHVEERHHVQFVEKCMLLQCIPCGSHFGDKEQLLVHVQAVHPSACKTQTVASEYNESSQKPEAGNSQIVVSQSKESTTGIHKFVCKFCGLKFNLLPDLGRHHQAEHMGNLVGSRGPRKGIRFNTYRMKSGRLSRPSKFKKSLGVVSYRIRNRAGVNMKRRLQSSKSLSTVLCNDISFGKERVAIGCVVDDDHFNSSEKPWESFTYVTKSVLNPSMDLAMENLQLRCGCLGSVCSPVTCDHVYLFGNDFEEARDIYGKPMRCRFPYDDKERIILEEGYPVYECNKLCRCSRTCRNRVLQNGMRVKLEVFRTESKGWGLRAREYILRGTFVCEYIGEVLDQQEADKRRNQYGKEGCSYIHNIDANINDIGRLIEGEPEYAIDATTHGNVSRFINHSCSPNLVTYQVIVESMESTLAHIGLYASIDIAPGEEITRDYGFRPVKSGHENEHTCHCRATNCRGNFS